MLKVFVTTFLIFGTVVGAGFSSGNEVVVFFSRFGNWSYFFITIASVMMFFACFFFLRKGEKISVYIQNHKLLNLIVLGITAVFGASMFAGIKNLFGYFDDKIYYFLMVILLLCCLLVTAKGIGGIEKANMILTPILTIFFLVVVLFAGGEKSSFEIDVSAIAGVLYCPLYVALNCVMSVFVVAKAGEKLNKKQAFLSSLFSAVLLFIFLMMCNFVLIRNVDSFISEMPILFIVRESRTIFILEYIVILVGCFTTLFSLLFTMNNALKKYAKNTLLCLFSAVFIPFAISVVGFAGIISFLYPICSIFGVFILLFAIFSLNKTDNIIHSKSKNTKDHGCSHN